MSVTANITEDVQQLQRRKPNDTWRIGSALQSATVKRSDARRNTGKTRTARTGRRMMIDGDGAG